MPAAGPLPSTFSAAPAAAFSASARFAAKLAHVRTASLGSASASGLVSGIGSAGAARGARLGGDGGGGGNGDPIDGCQSAGWSSLVLVGTIRNRWRPLTSLQPTRQLVG